MHIHVHQSYQGDCLLLESAGGDRILCDGGTPAAMNDWIAKELANDPRPISLIYISHIDSDHIGGIATLLDNAVQWKIFEFHQANGDSTPQPRVPKPPEIQRIWHNAFRDLITQNAGAIQDHLAATAPALQASQDETLIARGQEHARIATSVREALTVSRLIKPELLNVPLNVLESSPEHSEKLLMARTGADPETIGAFTIHILCPTEKELSDLREGWNHWLRDDTNRRAARKIREHYAGMLDTAAFNGTNPLDLHEWEGMPAYKNVTTPNVASLVLLVEEDDKRILLTGDNHPDMILAGLKDGGHLADDCIHLNVLKYQHHGSEHNISDKFPLQVSADHYIFCGDGSNTNPELSVLDAMFDARIGPIEKRAKSPQAVDRPFTFWFSTSPEVQSAGPKRDHMRRVVAWARDKQHAHPDRFTAHFSNEAVIAFSL